jgi:hypothetical protein
LNSLKVAGHGRTLLVVLADRKWTIPGIIALAFALMVGGVIVWALVALFTGGLGGM